MDLPESGTIDEQLGNSRRAIALLTGLVELFMQQRGRGGHRARSGIIVTSACSASLQSDG